jgi:hypothetical protein
MVCTHFSKLLPPRLIAAISSEGTTIRHMTSTGFQLVFTTWSTRPTYLGLFLLPAPLYPPPPPPDCYLQTISGPDEESPRVESASPLVLL